MLTLYFSPGACSLASHIGLEETGAPYEAMPILLAKGRRKKTEAYQKINPRGKVPTLSVDGEILSREHGNTHVPREAVSRKEADASRSGRGSARHRDYVLVLQYRASLVPALPSARAFCRRRSSARRQVKENGRKSFWANCQEIDSMFQGKDWIMEMITLVDPYALVFYGWGARGGFP